MSKRTISTSSHRPGSIRIMRIIARLNVGGPAVHVAILNAGLKEPEFTSMLVTGRVGEAEGDMSYFARRLGVEPVVIDTMGREISLRDDIKSLWALIRLIREFRPHIVHTHTAKAGFIGRLAAFLCRVPVVLHTFHGHTFHGYFGRLKTTLFVWLERLAALTSDVIVTISKSLKDDLLSYRIAGRDKIHVVSLGLPLSQYRQSSALQGELRSEIGLEPEHRLVGIIGRLVPIKNHALFIEAAQLVYAQMPFARFLIIGDGELRPDLENAVKASNLDTVTYFLGWRRDLPRIYADLDAVVISSNNEGTPVSLIEAMAAGVPVISTSVGGVPDLLQQGEMGTLVPAGNAAQLAGVILDVLSDDLMPVVSAAQHYAFDKYDETRLVSDMRALYLDLVAQKKL